MSCPEPAVPGQGLIKPPWEGSTESLLFYRMSRLCQHPFL